MDIQTKIIKRIKDAVTAQNITVTDVTLERPADFANGDFATNVALVLAKTAKTNPRELADRIFKELSKEKIEYVEKIDIAGPGFINFYLSKEFFVEELESILKRKSLYGFSNEWRGRKVLVEYTDPNPFKEFHIGHLMSNAIGESISRLIASQGAKIRRMCYQGDVGLHVAKAMWAIVKRADEFPSRYSPLKDRIVFIGKCYVEGSTAYEENPEAKKEIEVLNKKIFEGKERRLMKMYKLGRRWSLKHFEEIYKILGTKFDYYYLESEVVHDGVALVTEYLEKGVFEKSEGAVVFRGEKYDPKLHTRVFINSQGIPTYETKELGLNTKKWKKVRPDTSIIITANEQADYFRVLLKAFELIEPEAAKVTEHISHGMLRFAEGKMSSRKGNVITGESLIRDVEALVKDKLKERDMDEKEKVKVAEIVAISAIKYSILKQVTSSDIIYDFDKSISFEGDSGPYLLYTAVRASSVLEKAKNEKVKPSFAKPDMYISILTRHVVKFPEIMSRSARERAPHLLVTYLIELASMFNAWYAQVVIVNREDPESPVRVALTQAVRIVLENGLTTLGIKIPEKM